MCVEGGGGGQTVGGCRTDVHWQNILDSDSSFTAHVFQQLGLKLPSVLIEVRPTSKINNLTTVTSAN